MVRSRWGRCRSGFAGAVTGLLLVGCSSAATRKETAAEPGSPAGLAPAVVAASSTPSGLPSKTSGAVAAYRSMWADMAEASRTSDAQSPLLGDHADESALWLLQYVLKQNRKEGTVGKGAPLVNPQIVSAEPAAHPDTVKLEDCVDGTGWLQYRKDGDPKNAVPGGHHRAEATVRFVGSAWKVTRLSFGEPGSC